MANDIQLQGLIENVNRVLYEGDTFIVISIPCKNADEADNWAQSLGMEAATFEDGTIKVSRMGVHAVELSCGDNANVVLSWQGARPDAASSVDEEDDDGSEADSTDED
jgi:phosphosulfolactate synthase (CoM biosynthesis protein A)